MWFYLTDNWQAIRQKDSLERGTRTIQVGFVCLFVFKGMSDHSGLHYCGTICLCTVKVCLFSLVYKELDKGSIGRKRLGGTRGQRERAVGMKKGGVTRRHERSKMNLPC